MKEYLLSRKTMSTVSCRDLLQDRDTTSEQEAFVCAAKCLFADADSQSIGLIEADILRQLHSHHTLHPGRRYVVDFFGLYDQASKRGCFALEDIDPEPGMPDEAKGLWTLLLEYCQHGSIWEWIRQHPERIGYSQWLTWALQLLEAVDFIHDAGLVHHDIKPHNILEGLGRGTPPYSAPEMFASASRDAHYGQAIDIYSLGVSLYVIGLTAHEPFHKLKSVMEMIVWIKKGGFWLWESQNWIHDRGPIPKSTPSSRLSTSAAALALAQGHGQGQGRKDGTQSRSSLPRSSSVTSLASMSNLPPINTQLYRDDSTRGSPSASLVQSPGAGSGASRNHMKESPMSLPLGGSTQFLAGYSPESSHRYSEPSTPVSPLPLPSPIMRAQTPRSGIRKEENRKSGEVVMRFLNGEVVQPSVIQLLKDMCQTDPLLRPTAKEILQRLRVMKSLLDADVEEEMRTYQGFYNHSCFPS
ncbi:hypothetical protein BGX28_010069 [Mortierella sp. GBA30]|nr:hypothetical protein BGX28_010069 [Mortierella sp. GBA30]